MAYSIELCGQVAVVTGAARGLGAAIAQMLASAGAQLVVVDVLPEEDAAESLKNIAKYGLEPAYLRHDISDEAGCLAAVNETIEKFGRVDILVNNAAVSKPEWSKVFDINVMAHFYLNNAVYEDMKKRGYGRIVNITTSGTFSGGGDGIKYNATKGAADSLTRYQAKRFAPDGINVNAVAPGPMLTELMKGYYGEERFAEHYLPQMPQNRLLTPNDVASTVLFLCSPLASALCGETILADGGRVRLNPM